MKEVKSYLKTQKITPRGLYDFSRQFDNRPGYCTNINGLCEEDNCHCNKQKC